MNASEFLAQKTGGEGPSLAEQFDSLSLEDQAAVLKDLEEKKKKKPGPTSSAKESADNGI